MTTIAVSLTEMAADSCFSYEGAGTDVFPTKKLYRIGDSIFGEAGDGPGAARMIQWLQRGQKYKEQPKYERTLGNDEHAFCLVELCKEGIFLWDYACMRYPVRQEVFAIGSGRKVAMYCMRYEKKSPEQAVKAACLVDDGTREPVDVMRLA
jgi:hypothetical protein